MVSYKKVFDIIIAFYARLFLIGSVLQKVFLLLSKLSETSSTRLLGLIALFVLNIQSYNLRDMYSCVFASYPSRRTREQKH